MLERNGQEVPPSFGEALAELETIVNRLESEESLELEASLALYEHGVALAGACRQQLAGAQLRLTQIAVPLAAPGEEPA